MGLKQKKIDHPLKKLDSSSKEEISRLVLLRIQEAEHTAFLILDQLFTHKKGGSSWVTPIAKRALENMLGDFSSFKKKLEEEASAEEDLLLWLKLCEGCKTEKGLMSQILEKVASEAIELIEKDIQLAKEYRVQALSHLPQDSEEFLILNEAITKAIEGPLTQLDVLRKELSEELPIENFDWSVELQQKRQEYFDDILLQVDTIVKKASKTKEGRGSRAYGEVEGELAFMLRELDEIDNDLVHLHLLSEEEKQFYLGRLEGILDHLESIDSLLLPTHLRMRIEILKSRVGIALELLD